MAEQREMSSSLPVLDAWPGLEPDPAAMEQVVSLMVQGVQVDSQPAVLAANAGAEAREERAEERRFRLILMVWAPVALAGYLLWPRLGLWFHQRPYLILLAAGVLLAGLLAPLLLMPLQNAADIHREGGASA